MSAITNYYERYNEDERITSSKARRIEFTVTTNILNQYIKKNHKILELGAGTGVYSFYYAKRGNKVVATDLTLKHIEIIKHKMKKEDNLDLLAEVANATDLRQYENEIFDVVTCLGPIYHLVEEGDRQKCIGEALRVLKKGGYLAIAYINKHFIPYTLLVNNKSFLTHDFISKILSTGVIREGEKECFWTDAYFTSPTEMEECVSRYNVEIVDHVATDGISQLFRSDINEMNEEVYEAWIQYSLRSCRDKSILGISNHALLICKKH